MDTAVDHHDAEHATAPTHHSDLYYVKIAAALAVITGLEVVWSYQNSPSIYLPVLLIMMTIKFVMVVLFFMHLRFDNRLFGLLFWSGLGLAIGVYVAALATLKFFAT
jgi:cytochrome c oxidase subunit IV